MPMQTDPRQLRQQQERIIQDLREAYKAVERARQALSEHFATSAVRPIRFQMAQKGLREASSGIGSAEGFVKKLLTP